MVEKSLIAMKGTQKNGIFTDTAVRKEEGEKIGPLINEEHEINDESKMVEIMNSFVNRSLTRKMKIGSLNN